LSSLQKMIVALRILACGVAADYVNEYVQIGETIAIESLENFDTLVVSIFSNKYLRSPNINDVARKMWFFKDAGEH
jgi:hypothetical protein